MRLFVTRINILLAWLLIQVPAYAQDIKFGLRSGIGFSNFYAQQLAGEIPDLRFATENPPGGKLTLIDPNIPYLPVPYYKTSMLKDVRTGIFSYFYMDYELQPRLTAQIAIGYSQKGIDMTFELQQTTMHADNSTTLSDYKLHRNLRLDYITVPLTVQYHLDPKERFYLVGGIYQSVAVNFVIIDSRAVTNSLTRWSSGAVTASSSESEMTIAYANRYDAGLLAGVGLDFPLSESLNIGLDVRGSLGLLNVPKEFENYGFLGFSKSTKNLGVETGLKIQYSLR